jgi:hypothetical protein
MRLTAVIRIGPQKMNTPVDDVRAVRKCVCRQPKERPMSTIRPACRRSASAERVPTRHWNKRQPSLR